MEDGEAGGLAVELGDHRLGRRLGAEQRLAEQLRRAGHLLGGTLVGGELDDQRVDQLDVGRGRRPQRDRGAHPFPGSSISRLRILPVGPFGRSSTNQIRRGYL